MPENFYRTIMLVDDDVEDQEIFMEAINEVDPTIRCLCEDSSEVALNILSTNGVNKPDLLIIDLNMPRLNGKQLLRELKGNELLKHIPVIMFSTFFGPGDIREITDSGAAHYLIKSTNFADLQKSLATILSTRW